MSSKSSIQWTDATWNIAVGCTKVDADCKYCYMYRDSLKGTRYDPKQIRKTKQAFTMPLRYKETISACWYGRPLIFTCSLTDFFHEALDGYRHEAWEIIRKCPHLIFQILTKRPERIMQCLPEDWGEEGYENVWLGTSCGSEASLNRMVDLSLVPANKKFLSLEPLHGPIDLRKAVFEALNENFYVLPAYDWVIVGGESGNSTGQYLYRPCELEWIEDIVAQCKSNNIPVFVKQMGNHLAKQLGMKGAGGDFDQFPEHLQVREFPSVK